MESIDQNTSAQSGEEQLPLWIFGYGSLVWRPAFEHVEVYGSYRAPFSHFPSVIDSNILLLRTFLLY